jgi:hypothetical protein
MNKSELRKRMVVFLTLEDTIDEFIEKLTKQKKKYSSFVNLKTRIREIISYYELLI